MYTTRALYAVLLVLLAVSPGCDTAEVAPTGAPNVTFANTTLQADFYQAGSSSAPSIAWNGAQGTIRLGTALDGLSVNATTGQLTWTKLLPPGVHDVEVVVSNSGGQVVVPLTIENPLSGRFQGTYGGTEYFALDVQGNGTVTVLANSESAPDEAAGTWQIVDGTFVFDYVYSGDAGSYHVVATLDQTDTAASLNGDWFSGAYAPGASPGGSVAVALD